MLQEFFVFLKGDVGVETLDDWRDYDLVLDLSLGRVKEGIGNGWVLND